MRFLMSKESASGIVFGLYFCARDGIFAVAQMRNGEPHFLDTCDARYDMEAKVEEYVQQNRNVIEEWKNIA